MNYDCELIGDLLPLYEEGLCSGSSRRAVEAHLRECESCRALMVPLPIGAPEDPPAADRAVRKSMKKVKRRWLASLLAAVLIVPMLLLGFNQYRGYGLCYTNLDDVYTAWRFLRALETQDWEKAAKIHDFSGDYESILEALGLDTADWGITFAPCDLAGYDYAVASWLSRNGLVPATTGELYGYLYNRTGTAMVPLSLWEALMTMDPGAFSQNGWEYWLNGERYGKITTPWGDFVVNEGRGFDSAYEYCAYFDLVPAAIYWEAKPAIDQEAQQLYTLTHEHIGWVAELTEAEFTDEMIHRYTADLKSLEETASFDCTGWRSIGRCRTDGWCVFFSITISQNGKALDAEIQIDVKNGKILVAGISHDPGVQWIDAIDRVLYPSAHPEY